jgi:hypothetical protein
LAKRRNHLSLITPSTEEAKASLRTAAQREALAPMHFLVFTLLPLPAKLWFLPFWAFAFWQRPKRVKTKASQAKAKG